MASGNITRLNGKREREREIIAAARALFREKSFEATSMAEVAARAGTATGTVYLYARDKNDLLLRVLTEFVTELTEDLEAQLAHLRDPRERVRFVIGRHLATLLAEPELCALFVREVHVGGRTGAPDVQRLKQRYSAVLTSVLDEAMGAGVLRNDIPLAVARSVVFGGLEQLTLKTWTGRMPVDAAAGTDGLLRLLEPPAPAQPALAEALQAALDRVERLAGRMEEGGGPGTAENSRRSE